MSIRSKISLLVNSIHKLLLSTFQYLCAKIVEGASWSKILLTILAFVAVVEILPRWSPPVYPFTTSGTIFVDSPEVYTRERLVNDRYDQDHWLRQKLNQLDESAFHIEERTALLLETNVALSSSKDEKSSEEPAQKGDLSRASGDLTFAQKVLVEAGIRADLRQRILENLLDDRHDLSGNSLYGFKFDTTVLLGSNTRRKAFVKIQLVANNISQLETESYPRDAALRRSATYEDFVEASLNPSHDLNAEFVDLAKLYDVWLKNIANRLNRYVSRAYGDQTEFCSGTDSSALEPEIAVEQALFSVLSISKNEVVAERELSKNLSASGFPAKAISLSSPWGELFSVETVRGIYPRCPSRPVFFVLPIEESYFFFQDEVPEWARQANFAPVFKVDNSDFWASKLPSVGESDIFDLKLSTAYPEDFFKKHIERVMDSTSLLKDTNLRRNCRPGVQTDQCVGENVYYSGNIRSGVLNLIFKLAKQDSYSYAIFPKLDASGALSSQSLGATVEPPSQGVLARFGVGFERQGSYTKSNVVGFSDSAASKNGSIDFGWIIDPVRSIGQVQSAQMALISVPASADEVEFTVTKGWLGRNAEIAEVSDEYKISVALPPDFEAFETIIFDRNDDVRRQPVIFDEFMDENEQQTILIACEANRILIPGRRLWRSAEVTLGAYQADKIVVMPNMEGIIAIFDDLRSLQSDVITDGKRSTSEQLKLRVWTSEGVAESSRIFTVRNAGSDQKQCRN